MANSLTANQKALTNEIEVRREAQSAALASTDRLGAVLDAALNGIVSIDEIGTIELFNPGACKLFGYSSADVIGHNVKMLMPEDYAIQHDGFLQAYVDTGHAKIIGIGREANGLRKDGSEFSLFLWVSEYFLGDKRKFVAVIENLTERKKREDELQLAKTNAEAASRAKSHFLATMSH